MTDSTVPAPVRELSTRVHAAVQAGVGDLAPSTLTIPNRHYTDPAILEAELRSSFAAPLLVGAGAQIPNEGDYLTLDLAGTPVIVVRGNDRRARVLLNACRHRGAQVASGDGCSRRFTCPYHNWVYDTAGALVGIPGREGFSDIDQLTHGLLELPSEERHGFIWALRNPDGTLDLDDHLGEFGSELAAWGDYDVAATMELRLDSNWKCGLEAFQETYHFPYVHGSSIIGQGTVSNIVTFDQFGRHHRIGVPLSPMATADAPPEDEAVSCIYFIYPCTVIATSPIGGELLQFFPAGDPSSSLVRHMVLARNSLSEPGVAEFFEAYTPMIQAAVREEDGPVLESSGIGLSAGHTDAVIGRNEIGCQAAHRQILLDLDVDAGAPFTGPAVQPVERESVPA